MRVSNVFNPLSAKIAEAAGFEVLYLGYRILTVTTPIYAFHRAMQQTYRAIAQGCRTR